MPLDMNETTPIPTLTEAASAPSAAASSRVAGRRGATLDETAPGRTVDRLDPRLEGWRSFLTAYALVARRLDDELRVEQGISLPEYDALLQLAIAPAGTLRMNQLAERVLLSRSGVTRLVDRLVADGLVTRASCPSDARGAMAVLSERGRAILRSASQTHMRGVDRYFLSALTDTQLEVLRTILDAVVDRASKGQAPAACVMPDPSGAGADD